MPVWSNDVPDDPRGHSLPILRCPAATDMQAIITSDHLIGTDTHFWGGHTVPHSPPGCEPCKAGNGFRYHAYQSAFNPADQLHFIFECTQPPAKIFAKYRQEHGTLRGCEFKAYRWKRRRNGRVLIRVQPTHFQLAALPAQPNLENIMAIIWRLPIPNVFVAGNLRPGPRVHADPNGDGTSSDPRDYSHSRP